MADALCGPSNALQHFKQHTSVDRTLQQDRLVSRPQPGQGFRSHDPNAGILDPEFEAFQASNPSAFAGPAFPAHDPFQPFHPAQNTLNAGPSYSSPSQAPAWAADFQNLHIASPPPAVQQQRPHVQNAAWATQFQQTSGKSPISSGVASPGVQYGAAPTYGMNRGFMGGYQPPQFQASVQQAQPAQAPQEVFDEAAFEAAFDAAMEDAFNAQEQVADAPKEEPAARKEVVDIYPQLPLVRLALLRAIMDGGDRLLHEAALFVHQLDRCDVDKMDPVQALLLSPLITRLADQSRSHFASRYQMSGLLNRLSSQYQAAEKNARISPENEQLLAAYADCLWGRDQPDIPQAMHSHSADASYWGVTLEESMENWHAKNPTDQAMKMLSESNLFGISTPESMRRVQELEVKAYENRPFFQEHNYHAPTTGNPQDILFDMATRLRDDPSVQDAIKATAETKELQQSEQVTSQTDAQAVARARGGDARADHDMHMSVLNDQQQRFQMAEQQLAETEQRQREEANLQTHSMQERYGEYHEDHRWYETDAAIEEQQREKQEQASRGDDELANTAAELLEKISHEKSSKFQNSAFLGLMRKLADREVKVEGDKMVETRNTNSTSDTTQQHLPATAPSAWSQAGPMQAQTTAAIHPGDADGQEVVDLLDRPDEILDQDPSEYLMTSPFAHAEDY